MDDNIEAIRETDIDYSGSTVKSFVDGIKKDIASVKNAISLETNSGFVEGNNNKFKQSTVFYTVEAI